MSSRLTTGNQHGLVGSGDPITEHQFLVSGSTVCIPLHHIDRPFTTRIKDENGASARQRLLRPRQVSLGAAPHADQHLTRSIAPPGGDQQRPGAADGGLIWGHSWVVARPASRGGHRDRCRRAGSEAFPHVEQYFRSRAGTTSGFGTPLAVTSVSLTNLLRTDAETRIWRQKRDGCGPRGEPVFMLMATGAAYAAPSVRYR